MHFFRWSLLPFALLASQIAAQQPVALQKYASSNEMSSGGYRPSASSLMELLKTDHGMSETLLSFARTGDKDAYRAKVLQAAQAGDLAAELLLGEQYIPEQCVSEPNQDVPQCGKNKNERPAVEFRKNPLGIEASYEEASKWLEKASAKGSGEASEVLAQLITRMHSNGHGTSYTEADSIRFHSLARSLGFDVEAIVVDCYKLRGGRSGITLEPLPKAVTGHSPIEPFTSEELRAFKKAGFSGSLSHSGGSGGGDSGVLMRPDGPVVHVRIILDHNPEGEILLPMPAHHNQTYVQRGDQFLEFPSGESNLPRFITIKSDNDPAAQVSVFMQMMDGGHTGAFCAQFP